MKNLLISVLAILGLMLLGPVGGFCLAAIPNLSAEALLASATHVVRGKVQRVYSCVEAAEGDWERTYHIVELQVDEQQKGKSLGRATYIRFQSKRFVGKGAAPPGDYGTQAPEVGTKLRVFAAQADDGGLDLVTPNGFQPAT